MKVIKKKSEPTSVISVRVPRRVKQELEEEARKKGSCINDLCLGMMLTHYAKRTRSKIPENEVSLYEKVELFRFIKELNHEGLFEALVKISKKMEL